MDSVSVVIPIYNEVDNIARLHSALVDVLPTLGRTYEILFVDDGSNDGSRHVLREIAAIDPLVRVIEFRDNFGQTAAMSAGIQEARYEVIVTLDGDLQNDPCDIPRLLEKIDEGYELVNGWRKNRQDAFFSRKLPSRIANALIAKVTGYPVRDLGCTLKAMRRDVARELDLYGEMHRFIPILARWRGARCAEVVTNHQPRRFGASKYGLSRTLRVLLDLITVKYLIRYMSSPMKLFGMMGLVSFGVGGVAGIATVVMKMANGIDMTGNPLFLVAALSPLLGAQFLALGMLGEMGARIYFVARRMPPYAIRNRINFDTDRSTTIPIRDSFRRAA